jgi:hypothetical protein
MAGAGVIDHYVADLDVRLRGDKRAKLDLLTEARDSLEDAASCYLGAGFCAHEAERKAIHDFGPAPLIARDYQAELAAAYGARTLRSILFVLPVVQLLWEGTRVVWVGPWGDPTPAWYDQFAQLNHVMTWAVVVAAALALLVGKLWARRSADSRMIARCAAGVSLVAVGASLLATGALMVVSAVFDLPRLFVSPAIFLTGLVAVLAMVQLARMARRTAHFSA